MDGPKGEQTSSVDGTIGQDVLGKTVDTVTIAGSALAYAIGKGDPKFAAVASVEAA